MSAAPHELFLFCTDPALARRALAAGVDALVVDWEYQDKHRRQAGADTQVNQDTPEDLRAMAALGPPRVCCRVNGPGKGDPGELERALAAGATEVFLPMVRCPGEVEAFLEALGGRARAGILVETEDACAAAPELARLPLDWVYVGLNDLGIDRGAASLFEAVVDGTLDALRQAFAGTRLGFGGATIPGHGHPIPGRLLRGEMARLGCDFVFLRRSFLRDVAGRDMAAEVAGMRRAWEELCARTPGEVAADRAALAACVADLAGS